MKTGIVAAVQAGIEAWRERRALGHLSERMRQDIGVTAGQLWPAPIAPATGFVLAPRMLFELRDPERPAGPTIVLPDRIPSAREPVQIRGTFVPAGS